VGSWGGRRRSFARDRTISDSQANALPAPGLKSRAACHARSSASTTTALGRRRVYEQGVGLGVQGETMPLTKTPRVRRGHLQPCALPVEHPESVAGSLGPRMGGPHGGTGQFVQFRNVYAVTSISSSDARHAAAGQARARLAPRSYISPPMTRRFTRLAWTAATFTYLLIILGAIVPDHRIGTGLRRALATLQRQATPASRSPDADRVWTPPRRRRGERVGGGPRGVRGG